MKFGDYNKFMKNNPILDDKIELWDQNDKAKCVKLKEYKEIENNKLDKHQKAKNIP